MRASASFDYAVLRVVPRVERGEFINVGVVLLCREKRFLGAKVHVDQQRLITLWPQLDVAAIGQHVEAVSRICAGDPSAGPVALLTQSERFHWLTSPRSTVIQTSPVHTGLCTATDSLLEKLYDQLVR